MKSYTTKSTCDVNKSYIYKIILNLLIDSMANQIIKLVPREL